MIRKLAGAGPASECQSVIPLMAVTLRGSLQARWNGYLATENSGTRDAKIHALAKFVDELVRPPVCGIPRAGNPARHDRRAGYAVAHA